MNVIVIGCGIGGLATALSLHQAGIGVRLFETAPEIEALGVGINIQSNAVRELSEAGLSEQLAATGVATSAVAMYNRHGQLIFSEPRGAIAGFKWPQYSIHRGELLMLLLRAVRDRIGAENIRAGHHLVSFEQDPVGVIAHFIDRRSGERIGSERADVLVGADGIHSTVRANYYPDEGNPRFGGQIIWRGAVEADPFIDGKTMVLIGHRDHKFIAYPMSRRAADRGRSLINWITELTVNSSTPPREEWNKCVGKEAFAGKFADWRFPWIDVPGLIAMTREVYEFPKVDRDPIPRWSFGRVTLLGDAAHAMLPHGSQAGSQAIVDARVLTRALVLEASPEAAFRRYESERLPVMHEVTIKNRQLASEIPMQIVEQRAPNGFTKIEEVIPREEMEKLASAFNRSAGLDRDYVNTRPSILLDILPALQ